MSITKKHLPRRTFLRGLGVTMALPLLDAMIPARTALAQTAAAPSLRAGFIYFPHGAVMSQWTPEKTGTEWEFTPILKPLEAFKKQMTIISGLENKAAIAPPVHALSPGTWLSGVAPRKTQDPWGGKTIDQMVAERSPRTRLSRRWKWESKHAEVGVHVIVSTVAATRARFHSARPAR